MKKLSFLALAAVGLLFGACASNDAIDENATGQDPYKGREGGFVKIGISLPAAKQGSTRAWSEDDTTTPILDDGLDKEFAVNNAIVLFFEGASETTAVLVQVEDFDETFTKLTPDNPNQVTNTATKTVKLINTPSSNLYALAVINGTGIIEKSSDTKVSILGGAAVGGITLSDLQSATAVAGTNKFINTISGNDYFFMTNAVLSEVKGGKSNPSATPVMHTLAPVDASKIYETKTEADADNVPATDIYVERGVAKVTIDNTAADYLKVSSTLKDGAGAPVTFTATLTGWCIDNTNHTSYVVRNVPASLTWNLKSAGSGVSGSDQYRLVGGNKVDIEHTYTIDNAGYRTYWAEDPNYTTPWAAGMFDSNTTYSAGVGNNNPQYCFENTFDVQHQIHNLTTRVVLKVNLGGADFYTIGSNRNTMYTLADVKAKFAASLLTNGIFLGWWDDPDPAKGGKGTLSSVDIAFVDDSEAGVLKLKSMTIPSGNTQSGFPVVIDASATNIEGHDLSGLVATISSKVGKVNYFKGGDTYYQIRIKHFGEDLTPWNKDEYGTGIAPAESSWDKIYPDNPAPATRDDNYLGRYGMVRNNWYYLTIGEIAKIGSSTVPEVNRKKPTTPDPDDPEPDPEHPDDNLEDAYIKARINILSWAKRPQNWNLK